MSRAAGDDTTARESFLAQEKQTGLGDELFGTPMAVADKSNGPAKGEFIAPPDVPDVD